MMNSLFFFKPPIYSSEKSIYNHSVNLPSHLNNPISTTYPFSSCQLDPTAFLQWICLVPRLQPKIRELKFNLQPSENPLFHAFFTHYLSTLDIKQTHSTWLGSLTSNAFRTHCIREWWNTYFRLKMGMSNRYEC